MVIDDIYCRTLDRQHALSDFNNPESKQLMAILKISERSQQPAIRNNSPSCLGVIMLESKPTSGIRLVIHHLINRHDERGRRCCKSDNCLNEGKI
jgi:hypothetical protein